MREKAAPWLRELEHERALAKEWSNKNGGRSVWEGALENEEPAAKKQKKDEEIVESARCEEPDAAPDSEDDAPLHIPPKMKQVHCFTHEWLEAKEDQGNGGPLVLALKYGENYSIAEIVDVEPRGSGDNLRIKLTVHHTLDPAATPTIIIPECKNGFKFNSGIQGHLWMKATKATRANFIKQKKLKGTLSLSF